MPTTRPRAEADTVIQRWNNQLALGRDMLWSPTIRAALLAGTPWLDVFCPGCGTSKAIDLRTIDRHPLASVGTLVLGPAVLLVSGLGADAKAHRSPPVAAVYASRCRGAVAPGEEDIGDRAPGGVSVCNGKLSSYPL